MSEVFGQDEATASATDASRAQAAHTTGEANETDPVDRLTSGCYRRADRGELDADSSRPPDATVAGNAGYETNGTETFALSTPCLAVSCYPLPNYIRSEVII